MQFLLKKILYINTGENKDIFMGLEKAGLNLSKEIIAWTRTSGKSLLQTRPVKINTAGLKFAPNLTADTFCTTNPLTKINESLKNIYGIDANLTNLPIAEKVLSTVEDFCSVNKKKNLFKGLELNSGVVPTTEDIAINSYNLENGKFAIKFNESIDFNNLDKITKEAYNAGKIPADDPNCLLYREFGHFLNFKHNPTAYHVTTGRSYCGESELIARRLSDSKKVSDFNANYIAGRMCGKTYPKKLYTYFEENVGNTNLRFPKPTLININTGSVHKFKKITDAQKYLLDNYGIEAEFITQQQANYFAGAVDDLCKMTGDKTVFRGLKVTKDTNPNSLSLQMSTHWDYATGECSMTINPAYNWKQEVKMGKDYFQSGHFSTENPKDRYIHELAHWLDFKGNPVKYGQKELAFSSGETYFNDIGKTWASKVSKYAANSPGEFCAEYIAGRFNGIKYPKCVDDSFMNYWNGPALNFPK